MECFCGKNKEIENMEESFQCPDCHFLWIPKESESESKIDITDDNYYEKMKVLGEEIRQQLLRVSSEISQEDRQKASNHNIKLIRGNFLHLINMITNIVQ